MNFILKDNNSMSQRDENNSNGKKRERKLKML